MTHRWLNYTMAIMKKSFESVVIFKQFLLTHNSLNLMWQVTTITLHITSITTYLFYNKCFAWIFCSELCYIPKKISNILLWIRQDKIRWLPELTTVKYFMNSTNGLFWLENVNIWIECSLLNAKEIQKNTLLWESTWQDK